MEVSVLLYNFVSKLANDSETRKRGPNEAPLPHPQVSGGLGLGYMATSHACTEETKIPRFARDDNPYGMTIQGGLAMMISTWAA